MTTPNSNPAATTRRNPSLAKPSTAGVMTYEIAKPIATGTSTSRRAANTGQVIEAVSRRATEHIATVVAMTRTLIQG